MSLQPMRPIVRAIFRALLDSPSFASIVVPHLTPEHFAAVDFGASPANGAYPTRADSLYRLFATYYQTRHTAPDVAMLSLLLGKARYNQLDFDHATAALAEIASTPVHAPVHDAALLLETEGFLVDGALHTGIIELIEASSLTAKTTAVQHLTDALSHSFCGRLAHGRHLTTISCDQITEERVEWLWTNRLAMGALSLLAGREGLGKSLITTALIADLTTGRLEGHCKGTPRDCIIIATEDNFATTIVPRLRAAGADLKRVHQVTITLTDADGDHEDVVVLPTDIVALTERVVATNTALMVLDPLMSRLNEKLDSHKDAEVRRALEPIKRMAEVTGTAILGIIHMNKGTDREPLNQIMGSKAFPAVSRCVLAVYPEPNATNISVLCQIKNNLGPTNTLPLLPYSIQGVTYTSRSGLTIETAKLAWQAPDTVRTTQEFLATKPETADTNTKLTSAKEWLEGYLGNSPGRPSQQVKDDADFKGFSPATIKRAARELNVVQFQESGTTDKRHTLWRMPTPPMATAVSFSERFRRTKEGLTVN
jgi:hypothetical protein